MFGFAMGSIIFAGLGCAGLVVFLTGAIWRERNKIPATKSTDDRPAEHPYETPADRFMVWPSDPLIRAAPKGRARTMAPGEHPKRK